MIITYNAEFAKYLRAVFIGCGGHAIRNLYPVFQYAPIDLVAVCDLDQTKAQWCARQYGAANVYTDYRDMLECERPDVAFVCLNCDEAGRPRYPRVARDILQAGAHAWIEKPPASSSAEVRDMQQASRQTGRFVGVGFKKMFFPANVRAKALMQEDSFRGLVSITARYPQSLPPAVDRHDSIKMAGFLDHMVHPHSVLRHFAGPLDTMYVERHETGGAVVALRFKSGAVGSLLLSHGQSGQAPFERTELVGHGRSIVIDNNVRVYDYRAGGAEGGYGRAGSYFDTVGEPTHFWEPEFSLGQLYNKGIFLLGYGPEILYFCQCILDGTPPEYGNLDDALEMLHIYEAYCQGDGQVIRV